MLVEPSSELQRNSVRAFSPASRTLDSVLDLLRTADIRVSIFSFEARYGSIANANLHAAVTAAVDDVGMAFELGDGRIYGLVFGSRPPGANDEWVEARTIDRLNLALGGPSAADRLVEVAAVHLAASRLSSAADIEALAGRVR